MSDGQNIVDQTPDAAAAIEDTVNGDQAQEPNNIIEIDESLQEQAVSLLHNTDWSLDPYVLGQLGVILIVLGLAFFGSRYLRGRLDRKIETLDFKTTRKISIKVIRRLPRLVLPALAAVALYIAAALSDINNMPSELLVIGASLSLTVLAIIFAVSFIQSRVLARWISKLAVLIAALHLLGWWDETLSGLQSIRFGFGQNQINLLAVMKGLMFFAIFLWIARILSSVFEKQIKAADELTPSLKVLFSKLLKISLVFIAIMFGLNAIGFDMTTFALFGGAIGVGLGFGLQKVVSNFISGIILLLDRSIKPGDVIALEGPTGEQTFGWVNTLGARYVSIIRRDGKEHLIPNETLITERVENWSFSNNDVRIHIPIGVSYNTDVRKARELCMEMVAEEPRIKEFPKPICHVTGFGDSSVHLEIRGWINDPVNGIGNVKSAVLMGVWDKFHEHGIEIPYPQRDLHIRSIDKSVLDDLKAEIIAELKGGHKSPAKADKKPAPRKKSDPE
ncbi:MAG: mechanosensitive ion channel family protein [Pseudomonadota bacterium]